MQKSYTLKCIGGFRDGNVYPEFVPPGKVLTGISEQLFRRFKQSDPDGFEVIEVASIVPPPTKSKPQQTTKKDASKKAPEKEVPDGNKG